MKQKLRALTALLLALMLLCGCSMNQVGDLLSGTETVVSTTSEAEEASESEEQSMAAETVMNQAEAPEVLQLAYQEEYGLNPFTTVSLNNRTILSLLYEPMFVVNDEFQAEPVLASRV